MFQQFILQKLGFDLPVFAQSYLDVWFRSVQLQRFLSKQLGLYPYKQYILFVIDLYHHRNPTVRA